MEDDIEVRLNDLKSSLNTLQHRKHLHKNPILCGYSSQNFKARRDSIKLL